MDYETIYYRDKKYYIKNLLTDRFNTITRSNWHNYMSKLGWEKMESNWKIKLGKLLEQKNKNSCFAIHNSDADGNCLFSCIAEGYNSENPLGKKKETTLSMRKKAAKEINDENFQNIISIYRIEKMNEEFDGDWDPDTMTSPKKLQKVIIKGGYHFMGDHIMMSLLQKSLHLNIIIFDDKTLDIYVIDHNTNYDNYIMLFFEDRIH